MVHMFPPANMESSFILFYCGLCPVIIWTTVLWVLVSVWSSVCLGVQLTVIQLWGGECTIRTTIAKRERKSEIFSVGIPFGRLIVPLIQPVTHFISSFSKSLQQHLFAPSKSVDELFHYLICHCAFLLIQNIKEKIK